jgi:hypothetical protein
MAVCLGPMGLRFIGEVSRVLLLPEVFGLLALVIGLQTVRPRREADDPALRGRTHSGMGGTAGRRPLSDDLVTHD